MAAIVNRIDLLKLAQDDDGQFTDELLSPGEGRFVFQVTDQGGTSLPFTVILEYRIPVTNRDELGAWAQDWLDLAELELGTEEYNERLAALTERFAARDPGLVAPNNNNINQVRTNEIALDVAPNQGGTWELRELRLTPDGWLRPSTVNLTPDFAFSGVTVQGQPDPRFQDKRDVLAAFIQSCVRGEFEPEAPGGVTGNPFVIPHVLKPQDEIAGVEAGMPFLAPSAPTPAAFLVLPPPPRDEVAHKETWLADVTPTGPGTPAAVCPPDSAVAGDSRGGEWEANRRWFAFNTCSGCHAGEAGTFFTHVDLRRPEEDVLSSFLRIDDLPARGRILQAFETLFGPDEQAELPAAVAEAIEPETAQPSLADIADTLNRAQAAVAEAPPAGPADVAAESAIAAAEDEAADLARSLLQRQTRVH